MLLISKYQIFLYELRNFERRYVKKFYSIFYFISVNKYFLNKAIIEKIAQMLYTFLNSKFFIKINLSVQSNICIFYIIY